MDPLQETKNEFLFGRPLKGLGNMKIAAKIRPLSAQTFSHVGFSIKKNNVLDIIDNNAIQSQISINQKRPFSGDKTLSLFEKYQVGKTDLQSEIFREEGADCLIQCKRPLTAKLGDKVVSFNAKLFTDTELNSPRRLISGKSM